MWDKLCKHLLIASVLICAMMIITAQLVVNDDNWLQLIFIGQAILFEIIICLWFQEMQVVLNAKL